MYTKKEINVELGYKILTILSMVYLAVMLCNAILTNRYVGSNTIFILGGTLTSPFIFILDAIIAEIYGFQTARTVIISGYFTQTLFVIICQFILWMPYPGFFTQQANYSIILGTSLFRINFSGFFAYIIANLLNSYIIAKWKVLVKGKFFVKRNVSACIFSEAIYSFIAITMMEISSIPFEKILKVIFISFSVKVIYTIIFCYPARLFVDYVKQYTGFDTYDFPENLTPQKYKTREGEYA